MLKALLLVLVLAWVAAESGTRILSKREFLERIYGLLPNPHLRCLLKEKKALSLIAGTHVLGLLESGQSTRMGERMKGTIAQYRKW